MWQFIEEYKNVTHSLLSNVNNFWQLYIEKN